MATADDSFGTIDWSRHEPRRLPIGARTWAFLASLAAIGALLAYDVLVVPTGESTFAWWDVSGLDWLFLASLSAFVFYLLVPLYRDRALTLRYWRRLRGNRLAVASLAYLTGFFVIGLTGPLIIDQLQAHFGITAAHTPYGVNQRQPPWGFSKPITAVAPDGVTGRRARVYCTGTLADGICHGSLLHPFGTTAQGDDMLVQVFKGTRVALQVALITTTIIVPIATLVGTVAAEAGGRVDAVLSRNIDVVEVVPPFFVYLFVQVLYTKGLLLIVLIFGFLGWGGTARLVRSEALQKRKEEYVMAARSAGASRPSVVARHIVPNTSNTIVTAMTLLAPTLVVVEATLAYLGLGFQVPVGTGMARTAVSWGTTIKIGLQTFPVYWWTVMIPGAFLFATVVAFNLLGDALRDVLDPRLEGRR